MSIFSKSWIFNVFSVAVVVVGKNSVTQNRKKSVLDWEWKEKRINSFELISEAQTQRFSKGTRTPLIFIPL